MSGSDHIERLTDQDATVRRAALVELLAMGEDAAPTMVTYLSHPDWRVRRAGAIFADHHPDPELMERLRLTLSDPKAKVRMWAVHSLGCEPCKPGGNPIDPVPLLIRALEGDKASRVRRAAAGMLGQQGPQPRVLRALRRARLSERDGRVQATIAWAHSKHAPPR